MIQNLGLRYGSIVKCSLAAPLIYFLEQITLKMTTLGYLLLICIAS